VTVGGRKLKRGKVLLKKEEGEEKEETKQCKVKC